MSTPDEIRRNDLERDRLLQVNRALPRQRPPVVVVAQQSGLPDAVRRIAERGHEEYGCGHPGEWCAFCELLENVKKG